MEELIYLIIELIVKGIGRASAPPNRRPPPPSSIPATKRQVADRLLAMSQAPRRPAPPVAPARPIVATPTISLAESSWVEIEEATPQSRKSTPAVTMDVPARTLRQRFIMTEILRAPVSLRPPEF